MLPWLLLNINNRKKTSVYHTVNGDLHCFTHRKQQKWYRISEYKITCGLCLCVCLCVRRGFGGRISRKRSEIEVWLLWGTNRKWHMADRLVMWPMTSSDLERSRSWPRYKNAHYVENGWRYRLGYNRASIENGTWEIQWSRDRWRHVTWKGQGRDPAIKMPIISKMVGDRDSVTIEHL